MDAPSASSPAAAADSPAAAPASPREDMSAPAGSSTSSLATQSGTAGANPPAPGAAGSGPARGGGLEGDVSNLVGGFTSFWGRVKKQSAAALQEAEKQYETARADFTPLLNQARTQFDHLSEQTRAEIQRLSEAPASGAGTDVIIGPDGVPIMLSSPSPAPEQQQQARKVDKGKGVERGGDDADEVSGSNSAQTEAGADADQPELPPHSPTQQTPAAAASAFFSKWQTQLASNPNVKDLSRNITSLQSNFSTNLHQIQNQIAHIDLAEGQKVADRYLHKGEAWFQEFSNEVAHLAKEAVKVVPPTGAGAGPGSYGRSGFERAGTPVMTRRDMVLHKLRSDAALLRLDPALPPAAAAVQTDLSASTSGGGAVDTRESYAAYLATLQAKGGPESDAFRADIERELLEGGEVLAHTRDEVVSEEMPEEMFWTRYFFRKQGIEEEEERRKKVLQVAQQDDDDFSWDMDDEESVASPRVPQEPAMTAAAAAAPAPSTAAAATAPAADAPSPSPSVTPTRSAAASARADFQADLEPALQDDTDSAATAAAPAKTSADVSPATSDGRSPRASSDGTSSYDLVGEKSGNPSADERERVSRGQGEAPAAATRSTTLAAGEGKTAQTSGGQEDEDEDSDWE
ncbi:hypothetical protein JCM8202_001439 [Rhodotorula sphaerocarpa]